MDLLAAQLRNLDNLSVTDAAQLLKVQGPRGTPVASPPDVLAKFSARLLPRTVLAQLSQLVAVVSHQPTQRPGLLLVRVASPDIATLLYGTILSTPFGSITLTTGTDSGDTHWETSHGLDRAAPWEVRLPLIQAIDMPPSPLSAEALLGLQASSSAPTPPDANARPKKVAEIFSRPRPTEESSSSPMQEN